MFGFKNFVITGLVTCSIFSSQMSFACTPPLPIQIDLDHLSIMGSDAFYQAVMEVVNKTTGPDGPYAYEITIKEVSKNEAKVTLSNGCTVVGYYKYKPYDENDGPGKCPIRDGIVTESNCPSDKK